MASDGEKSRLKDLIEKLIAVPETEEELDSLSEETSKLSPDPSWSNYIYYSKDFENSDGSIDIDRVVEKVFQYKPIIL